MLLCQTPAPLSKFTRRKRIYVSATLFFAWINIIVTRSHECTPAQFSCDSLTTCIPKLWRCDNQFDCKDHADEANCEFKPCDPADVRCNDGKCIPASKRCDSYNDCGDFSDEWGCNRLTVGCDADQFVCGKSGRCLPGDGRCNGLVECEDGSDEKGCNYIVSSALSDVSTSRKSIRIQMACGAGRFACFSTRKCINASLICNHANDCEDGSDEPAACLFNECNKSRTNCSQLCVDDPIGYHCDCFEGFTLLSDNKTCHDIDECRVLPGACSGHVCINDKGGYRCKCFNGYDLTKYKTCGVKRPRDLSLLYSNGKSIRSINMTGANQYSLLRNGLHVAVAIDYNARGNYIVWSDVFEKKIFISSLNRSVPSRYASSTSRPLIEGNVGNVEGLAIDWIHNLIYWTDNWRRAVGVGSVGDPRGSVHLISRGLNNPRAIAVNPFESFIVWTDWGAGGGRIERSLEDGSRRKVLVGDNVLWPSGLSIDTITKKIYWIDAKLHSIFSIGYNGNDRQTVLSSQTLVKNPFSLDVFEDHVYWSDWRSNAIYKTNKFGGKNDPTETLVGGLLSVMDIRVYHPLKQTTGQNRCVSAKCSNLCLPNGLSSYSCFCPFDTFLSEDNYTCVGANGGKQSTAKSSSVTERKKITVRPTHDQYNVTVLALIANKINKTGPNVLKRWVESGPSIMPTIVVVVSLTITLIAAAVRVYHYRLKEKWLLLFSSR